MLGLFKKKNADPKKQIRELLGDVELPPVEVLEIGEDYVIGLYRDELEVEYVQVYELAKPTS